MTAMVAQEPEAPLRAVYSVTQAAELLGVSRRTVYNLIAKGYLPQGPITGHALRACWRMKKYNIKPQKKSIKKKTN